MAWLDRLMNLFQPGRHSSDLDKEMGFHLAEREDALKAEGMSETDASLEARRRFGNRGVITERTRDVGVLMWLDTLLADLRHAGRALRANPGLTVVALLSLGLGIGANTAIFSLINAVMLKSLPVSHPETLMKVTSGKDGDHFTNPLWEELRSHPEPFSGAFATGQDRFNLAQGGPARPVDGEWVSGDYFTTLGVPAILGRTITRADDFRGCPAIAVIGYGLWQSEFGGARDVVGKTLLVSSYPFTVAGVVDRSFFGVEVGRQSQLFLPICSEPAVDGSQNVLDHRGFWFLTVMARPADGATAAQTGARLAALAPSVFQAVPPQGPPEFVASYLKRTLAVEPAAGGFSNLRLDYGDALRVLMIVVALVLLIACANVANLLLARATARQHEAAIRLALGAGRGRLLRQMLTEAILLSLLGAALGVLFASWGTNLLVGFLSTGNDVTWLDLTIDRRVLGFTIVVALVSGILAGLAPAWRSSQASPQAALKSQGRSVAGGRRRIGWALVAGQVALSFVLLTSAGLLLNSFRNLMNTQPGFDRSGVLLMQTQLADTTAALRASLLERLRGLPGVRSAALSTMTPLGNFGEITMLVPGGADPAHAAPVRAAVNHISEGYLATVGTRLLRGRDVGPSDNIGSSPVVIITQSVARRMFGTGDPIGSNLLRGFGDRLGAPMEVIGVVEDSRFDSIRDSTSMIIYLPVAQNRRVPTSFTVELRSTVPPMSLVRAAAGVMAELSPSASLQFTTLSDQVARSLSRDRLLATLATFFGALALVLALIGLYGTMSYNVARRKNEIGIRIALGAARARVIQMVVGEVGVVVLLGLGLGVMLALMATRLVASFLFGLTASDPVTWIGSAGVLLGVALLAGAAPAWRAARMDPMTALREE